MRTSSGNVGIGTTSPNKNLTVEWLDNNTSVDTGEGLGGGTAGSGVLIQNGSYVANTYANLDFRSGNADGRIAYKYNSVNDGDFHFITDDGNNPETKLFIKNNGNVGIGTTSPSEKLEVTGNIAVSGSVQKQISTTHHCININSSTGSSQDFWIPFIEKNEQPSPNVTHKTVAPYDGVLKKVIVHSTGAFATNAQIRFHRINNGATKVFANDNSTDDVTTNVTADMSTAYSSVAFNFTSGNTFSAGDQIGLGIVRNNTAVGDVAITAVWEYELF
jgi:hypothetical protein